MQAKHSSPQSRKRARASKDAKRSNAVKRSSPSSTAIIKPDILSIPEAIEKVLILGDLSSLQPQERVDYYKRVCNSLGLNPLTMPFSYILFREFDGAPAKLSLYANKSCTEQLRKIHGVSVVPPMRRTKSADIITVEVDVRDRTGRTDTASGSVPTYKIKDGKRIDFSGKDLCNADMKCETKAKRRATLSISGLAFLDESELDTMQVVGGVTPDGRIFRYAEEPAPPDRQLSETADHGYPAGSEKAKQAEETLRRVEAADKAAMEARKPMDWKAQHEADKDAEALRQARTVLPKAEVPKEQPKAAQPPANTQGWPILEAESINPDRFQIFGFVPELLPVMEQCCKSEDGFWFCTLEGLNQMRTATAKYKFQLKVVPSQSAAKGAATKKATTPAAGDSMRGASEPELVVGTIEQVFAPPNTATPMRQVKILLADGKKPTFGCFKHDLFAELDKAKGAIEVYVTKTVKGDKTFHNIVGLKRLGTREWEADGTPVVQRKDQEAGQKTLY